jgi:hypothetical protein
MTLHTSVTSTQVTYTQPPPAGSVAVIIPNQALQNEVTVTSSAIDNPGAIQPLTANVFPYGVSDVYSVNQNLTQVFPVNAPPAP